MSGFLLQKLPLLLRDYRAGVLLSLIVLAHQQARRFEAQHGAFISLRLANESIATSGTYRQNYQPDGRRYSHLIDPHTARPITHRTVSVSVRDADCAHADGWATALNVLGVEAGLQLADRFGLAAQFVFERSDGRLEVQSSTAWRAKERVQGAPSATKHWSDLRIVQSGRVG